MKLLSPRFSASSVLLSIPAVVNVRARLNTEFDVLSQPVSACLALRPFKVLPVTQRRSARSGENRNGRRRSRFGSATARAKARWLIGIAGSAERLFFNIAHSNAKRCVISNEADRCIGVEQIS